MKRLALLLLLLPSLAAAALPEHSPRPGGIALIALGEREAPPEVRFEGRQVLTIRDGDTWYAVVGIPLDRTPGAAALDVDGQDAARHFEIGAHAYREQRLTVAPSYVDPSPEALARIERERGRIAAAISHWSDEAPTSLALAAPLPGRRSDSFGSRRVFNDQPRSPHRGMDISGRAGEPVRAPLSGTVIEAADFYFTGNAVFLDHGQGLVTLYAHLSRIDVETGQRVEAGETLGAVGATGRVTGPHLHFATYLNGTPVDPALLFD